MVLSSTKNFLTFIWTIDGILIGFAPCIIFLSGPTKISDIDQSIQDFKGSKCELLIHKKMEFRQKWIWGYKNSEKFFAYFVGVSSWCNG